MADSALVSGQSFPGVTPASSEIAPDGLMLVVLTDRGILVQWA